MELRQLRHFIAVCEHRGYARAAQVCATSQSAITKSVQKLEVALGTRLLERGRFGASPTEAGEALLLRARAMVGEEEFARREIEDLIGGTQGRIAIGAGLAFCYRLLPEVITRYHKRLPGVGISIIEGTSAQLFRQLMEGQLDFVISSPASDFALDPGLVSEPLHVDLNYHDYVVVGRNHPLFAAENVAVEDLARYSWVAARSADYVLSRIASMFERIGLTPPDLKVRTDSPALVKSLLRSGPFIGILGLEFFRVEAEHDLLRRLPMDGFDWPRRALITRRRRSQLRRPAAEFIRETKALANELIDREEL